MIISDAWLDDDNMLAFEAANIGQDGLYKGWEAQADVYFGKVKQGSVSLNDPLSIKNGGIGSPGGTSVFQTKIEVAEETTVFIIADVTQAIVESNEQNNVYEEILSPSFEQPDLIIGDISLADGDRLAFEVMNVGKIGLEEGWSAIAEVYFNQTKKGSVSLNKPTSTEYGGIGVGGGSSYYRTNFVVNEEMMVTVTADTAQAIEEADEGNNSLTVELSPQPAADLPDLKVAGITVAAENHLAVIIWNDSETAVSRGSSGIARIRINGQQIGFFDLGKPTESFFGGIAAAGGFSSYLIDYTVGETINAEVYVDYSAKIQESNEQNNILSASVAPRGPRETGSGLPSEDDVSLNFQIGTKTYNVNGRTAAMDVAPVIYQGRTFMPVRYVSEAVNSDVFWDPGKQKVTVKLGLKTIELWIGGNVARINGEGVYIDPGNMQVVPFISNSRTYLPLRFISEVLGGLVQWNSETRAILLDFAANQIDDDIVWFKAGPQGAGQFDDDIVWNRVEQGVS